jgi:hypothetical protein
MPTTRRRSFDANDLKEIRGQTLAVFGSPAAFNFVMVVGSAAPSSPATPISARCVAPAPRSRSAPRRPRPLPRGRGRGRGKERGSASRARAGGQPTCMRARGLASRTCIGAAHARRGPAGSPPEPTLQVGSPPCTAAPRRRRPPPAPRTPHSRLPDPSRARPDRNPSLKVARDSNPDMNEMGRCWEDCSSLVHT